MALHRAFDGREPLDPVGRLSGPQELRPATRDGVVARGTLACPRCDAPVAPAGAIGPADALACPVCDHGGAVRDFLSLAAPSRPARVVVRVI